MVVGKVMLTTDEREGIRQYLLGGLTGQTNEMRSLVWPCLGKVVVGTDDVWRVVADTTSDTVQFDYPFVRLPPVPLSADMNDFEHTDWIKIAIAFHYLLRMLPWHILQHPSCPWGIPVECGERDLLYSCLNFAGCHLFVLLSHFTFRTLPHPHPAAIALSVSQPDPRMVASSGHLSILPYVRGQLDLGADLQLPCPRQALIFCQLRASDCSVK